MCSQTSNSLTDKLLETDMSVRWVLGFVVHSHGFEARSENENISKHYSDRTAQDCLKNILLSNIRECVELV
jgi:hypothetical protein